MRSEKRLFPFPLPPRRTRGGGRIGARARGGARARRGMSSMLAMLYLVLFSTLAVGFYAAVSMSVQVSASERRGKQTLLAAESGMEFMRYVLSQVQIPHGTPIDQTWTELCNQVKLQLDGTQNLGGGTVTDNPDDGVLELPKITLSTAAGQPSAFSGSLTRAGERVTVRITGYGPDGAVHRTVQMQYARAKRASAIFDYGVASKAAISMKGDAQITGANDKARGSVLSMTGNAVPLTMTGTPSISGDFSYTNTSGAPSFGGGTIAGLKSGDAGFWDHIHSGVVPPEFPTIDTAVFEPFVPARGTVGPGVITSSPASVGTFTNVRIKAGANPQFAGGSTIEGVMYIETPNQVKFTGDVTIKGVIVVQNDPTGDANSNVIEFGGNVAHQGVEALDKTKFGALTELTGSFLLAPSFNVVFRGTTNSIGGTMVTSKLDISGSAGANITGTVINLDDTAVTLTGNSGILISSVGTTKYPTGVYFGVSFAPCADTYQEIQ